MHSNLFGPSKAVCYREVSTIRGVCYKRLPCIMNPRGQVNSSLYQKFTITSYTFIVEH